MNNNKQHTIIMTKQKKFILQENQIPTQWYNIQADMPNKPLPQIGRAHV